MRFLLDTEAIKSPTDGYKTAAKKVSSIADTVSGFDTSCEDGFDFAGAKSVIVANLTACANRMNNTAAIVDGVVETHTSLQKAFTYENFMNPPESKKDDANIQYYSGSHSGGGGYNSYSSGSGYYSDISPFVGSIIAEQTTQQDEGTGTAQATLEGTQVSSEKSQFKAVSYAKYDTKKLSKESKEVLDGKTVTENGYLKIDNRYVVACDPSIAKVGSIFRFTGSDGKTVECVVGINTVKPEYKDKFFLIVGDKSFKPVDFAGTITAKDTKVESLGNVLTTPPAPTSGIATGVTENPNKVPDNTTVNNESSNITAATEGETTVTDSKTDSTEDSDKVQAMLNDESIPKEEV